MSATDSRLRAKFTRWINQLVTIREGIHRAAATLNERLVGTVALNVDPELLTVAMFQPSTRNVFLEIETHHCRQGRSVQCEHARRLSLISDLARVLALVGDAALSIAVVHRLWNPSVLSVGRLTQVRAKLVSNEKLAQVCDRWGLYEMRIHFDPEVTTRSEIDRVKGTLVEAIIGAIYVEHGIDGVVKTTGYILALDEMQKSELGV
ncbi:MAG: ribonuclease III domain-containing protein [Candidatus Thorarchaeota archaeon]